MSGKRRVAPHQLDPERKIAKLLELAAKESSHRHTTARKIAKIAGKIENKVQERSHQCQRYQTAEPGIHV
jgi:hypothetical protein